MKSIDFSKGVRGKYAKTALRVVGDKQENSQTTWAICVTSKQENLTPLKIYEVKIRENSSEVEVIKDESDMSVICPREFFLSIQLPEKEVELLNRISLSI